MHQLPALSLTWYYQVLYFSLAVSGNAQENFNGCLKKFLAAVDKNISRKCFEGFSLYNIILIHAWVQSESAAENLSWVSLTFFIYVKSTDKDYLEDILTDWRVADWMEYNLEELSVSVA